MESPNLKHGKNINLLEKENGEMMMTKVGISMQILIPRKGDEKGENTHK